MARDGGQANQAVPGHQQREKVGGEVREPQAPREIHHDTPAAVLLEGGVSQYLLEVRVLAHAEKSVDLGSDSLLATGSELENGSCVTAAELSFDHLL